MAGKTKIAYLGRGDSYLGPRRLLSWSEKIASLKMGFLVSAVTCIKQMACEHIVQKEGGHIGPPSFYLSVVILCLT